MARTIRSARLIGRTDELKQFAGALSRAAQGQPYVLVIGGDAGIGKTRLLDEFERTAADAGIRMAVGSSLELGAASLPYAAVVEALRRLVAAVPPGRRRDVFGPASAHGEIARAVPELGSVDMPRDVTEAAPLIDRQARLFGQIAGLLERVAERGPVVLAFDDLHWADQSTLDLVAYLINALDGAGVVLVLTYRSDELTRRHPLRPLLARLQREPGVGLAELAPLDRSQLAELATAIRGDLPDTALLDDLQARSEGNPFFAEELLAAAHEGSGALPNALAEVMLTRVDRLSEDAQAVVRTAAAAGREVDHELLALIAASQAGLSEQRLLQALREAVAEQVLVVSDDGVGYAFRHALLQEAVHGDLLPGERIKLHAEIAQTLAVRPELAGRAGATAALAWHYAASHDQPRALEASLAAAAAADEAAAFADAQHHMERALELWDNVPDAAERVGMTRGDVIVLTAAATWNSGDAVRSLRYARQAIEQIDEEIAPLRAGMAWMWLARSLHTAGMPGAVDAFQRAVELVPPEPSPERARVLNAYANALMLQPNVEAAADLVEEAVRVATQVDAQSDQLHALVTKGVVRAALNDVDEGLVAFADARALAQRQGLLDLGRVYVNQSDVLFNLGRIDEALRVCEEGLTWARDHGLVRSFGTWLNTNLAEFLLHLGRLEEARPHVRIALGIRGADVSDVHVHHRLAQLLLLEGRLDEADETLSAVAQIHHGIAGGAQFEGPRAEMLAELAFARGDPAAALEAVEEGLDAVERADGVLRYGGWLYVVGLRAASALDPPDRDRRADGIRARLEARRASATRGISPLWAAHTAVADAEWATLRQSPDLDEWWRDAEMRLDALQLLPAAIQTRLRHAEALLPGERAVATELLERAWRDADDAQLARLRDDAERVGRRANIPLVPDEDAPFGLTPRELEVLRLVAQGRSNPEIGQTLFISRKTASVHVSNILSKLGARSRGEAAAMAHRAGLTG